MRRKRWRLAGGLLLGLLSLLVATAASAQSFRLFRPGPVQNASPQILNGTIASLAAWPATYVLDKPATGPCTVTVIGPRALITAAHCVKDGEKGELVGGRIGVTCWWHERYHPEDQNAFDVAMCLADRDIRIANSGRFEALIGGAPAAATRPLTLLGYGCTEVGGTKGVLYEGESSLTEAIGAGSPSFRTSGGAAVCAGDSGGGAYQPAGPGGGRRLAGIAAKALGDKESRFTAIGSTHVQSWITSWAGSQTDKNGNIQPVRICGLDPTLSNCRS
jgi:hypothetical protein